MKVLLLNGSPHPQGCTFTALSEIAATLNQNRIEAEIFQLGTKQSGDALHAGSASERTAVYLMMIPSTNLSKRWKAATALL